MGMKRLSANPFIPIYILCNYPFIKIISVWEKLLWSLLKKAFCKMCATLCENDFQTHLENAYSGNKKIAPTKL
jgi:hypothetical protein